MKKYIKVHYQFLERTDITAIQAMILSYLKNHQDNKKYCFKTEKQLAELFNTPYGTFRKSIKDLIDKELIFKSQDRKYLIAYSNKKALILVDENNELPEKPVRDAETHAEDTISKNRYTEYEEQMKLLKREQKLMRQKQEEESKSRIEELLNNAPRLSDEI